MSEQSVTALEAEAPVTTMELEMPVTTVEGIEDITETSLDDEGIETIDSMVVEEGSEGSEWSEDPTADAPEFLEATTEAALESATEAATEAPPLEDTVEDNHWSTV